MPDPKREHVIAVVNSNEDTAEMLRSCLEQHGFSAVATVDIHDFKTGQSDLPAFIQQHDPRVIVYDVSLPYDKNWRSLRLLLDTDAMRGRTVVLTTPNKHRLEEFVGPTDALEIVGKPYDLEQIVGAVRKAIGVRP